MRVALTGGSGFLGSEITRQAIISGLDIVQLSRQRSKIDCDVKHEVIDFNHPESINNALRGCTVLVHCIGVTNGPEKYLKEVNVNLTRRVANALPESISRVLYISSAAAAMEKGFYGKAKLEAESLLHSTKREVTVLRPTLIYGPGDTKNLQMMIDVVKKYPIVPVLGGGNFMVQPVHVEDVAAAVIVAITSRKTNEIYNVCGPEQVSLRNMLEELRARTKSNTIFVSVPLGPVQVIMKLWATICPNTKLPVKQVLELDKHERFDYEPTQVDLSFTPRLFQDGLSWVT